MLISLYHWLITAPDAISHLRPALGAEWARAKDKTLNLTIRTPVGSLIKATQSDVRGTRWETLHPFTSARFKLSKRGGRKKTGPRLDECSLGGGRIKECTEMTAGWERQREEGSAVGRASLWCSQGFQGAGKRSSTDSWEPTLEKKYIKLGGWQQLWMHMLCAKRRPCSVPLRRILAFPGEYFIQQPAKNPGMCSESPLIENLLKNANPIKGLHSVSIWRCSWLRLWNSYFPLWPWCKPFECQLFKISTRS